MSIIFLLPFYSDEGFPEKKSSSLKGKYLEETYVEGWAEMWKRVLHSKKWNRVI